MSDRNPLGEHPFPFAGEGVFLRFRWSDKAALQKKFGPEWFNDALKRIASFDMEFIAACLELGAKKDGKPYKIDLDKLDAAMDPIATAVLNGLFVSMFGQTFEERMKEIEDKAKAAQAGTGGDDPLPKPSSPPPI